MTAELLTLEREVKLSPAGIYVRSLTAGEQIDLEAAMSAANGDVRKILAAQLALYVCDDNGVPVLDAETAAKFVEVRNPQTVKSVIDTAGELNGWGEQVREDLRGN